MMVDDKHESKALESVAMMMTMTTPSQTCQAQPHHSSKEEGYASDIGGYCAVEVVKTQSDLGENEESEGLDEALLCQHSESRTVVKEAASLPVVASTHSKEEATNLHLNSRQPQHLRWGKVTVYHHKRIVGENPGCTDIGTVAWEIDWECLAVDTHNVAEYEARRRQVRRLAYRLMPTLGRRCYKKIGVSCRRKLSKGFSQADEIRLERAASYHSRPREEVQDFCERLQAAKEMRRLLRVELRKEKFAQQDRKREEASREANARLWEGRKRKMQSLFGFETIKKQDGLEEEQSGTSDHSDDEMHSNQEIETHHDTIETNVARPESSLHSWTRAVVGCLCYPPER